MSTAKDGLYAPGRDGRVVAEVQQESGRRRLRTGRKAVALRDSRHPERGDLRFTPQEWTAFCAGMRDGEFD
ncbi:DUF397 domain-containing protein [Streptomyces violens]|uniref:DUF397 domain-containing protein n=1 Tax=Streptomyces violens TaxID=66377 RepID=UPI000998571A